MGFCREVTGSSNFSVWEEPWIPSIPGFRVEGLSEKKCLVSHIQELMDDQLRWDVNKVMEIFPDHEAAAILKTPINVMDTRESFLWLKSIDGSFSSKSVYKLLKDEEPSSSMRNTFSETGFDWVLFWKLKGIAPRVLLFVWRVLHHAIPVNAETERRLETTDPLCGICLEHKETIEHALMHCSHAKMIWFASPLGLPMNFDSLTMIECLSQLLHRPDKEGFKIACFLLWSIWKARCNFYFKKRPIQVEEVTRGGLQMYNDFNKSFVQIEEIQLEESPIQDCISHWSAPPTGWISICLDGACKDRRMASAVVVRDENGHFVHGVTKFESFGSPIEAEANALNMGLDVMEDLNLTNCILESDCQALVFNVFEKSKTNWRIRSVVQRTKTLLQSRLTEMKLQFIPRAQNKIAHSLAAEALRLGTSNVWSLTDLPSFLTRLIQEDTVST